MKKTMLRTGTLVAVALLAAGMFAAACGGSDDKDGGDGTVSLDEYFQQIDELAATLESDLAAVPSDDPSSVDDAVTQLSDVTAAFDSFANGLDDIDPPAEAADAHDATASSMHDWVDELNGVSDEVAGAASGADALALLNGLDTSGLEASQQGCRDLQEVADSNQIDVDLGCSA